MNPSKAKGTRFEREVREYLSSRGLVAFKPTPTTRLDEGDLHVEGSWVLQAKAYGNIADGLRLGVAGAIRQRVVAGLPWCAAVVKIPRANVKEARVALTLEHYADLLLALRALQSTATEDPSA